MSSDSLMIPTTMIARAIWESNHPVTAIADRIDVVVRYLHQVLSKDKVGVELANQITSFTSTFSLPFSKDQVPVVRLSRQRILSATTLPEIKEHIALLKWEHRRSKEGGNLELEAMMDWQIGFALHRAAVFAEADEAREFQIQSKIHADKMLAMLPQCKFHDPALMQALALRNAATSSYLATEAAGGVPSHEDIREYIGAYDEAERQIGMSLVDITDEVARASAHIPMYRALRLDRVELAAYLNDPKVIKSSIAKLRESGTLVSGRVYQLALESIPSDAKSVLWKSEDWRDLMKWVNAQVGKFDKQEN
jgi:hypothetical protein